MTMFPTHEAVEYLKAHHARIGSQSGLIISKAEALRAQLLATNTDSFFASLGLARVPEPGDNQCLFHALARFEGLSGNPNQPCPNFLGFQPASERLPVLLEAPFQGSEASATGAKLLDRIACNADTYWHEVELLSPGHIPDYVEGMASRNAWGVEMQACAVFQRSLLVYGMNRHTGLYQFETSYNPVVGEAWKNHTGICGGQPI